MNNILKIFVVFYDTENILWIKIYTIGKKFSNIQNN